MSVKCLSKIEKDAIIWSYLNHKSPLVNLAATFQTSTRTIGRVLEEAGLATPVPRLKGEGYLALQACKKHGIDPKDLDNILAMSSLPVGLVLDKESVGGFLARCSYKDLRDLLLIVSARITVDLKLPDGVREIGKQLGAATLEGADDDFDRLTS